MDEAAWLSATDPHRMLYGLGWRVGTRKLLLYACACARRAWHLLATERDRRALEALEGVAEPLGLPPEHGAGIRAVVAVGLALAGTPALGGAYAARYNTAPSLLTAVSDLAVIARVAKAATLAQRGRAAKATRVKERRAQRHLLRDIVGPLAFRPVALDPVWRTPTVVAIAQRTYEERNFRALPVLADALEEAGCTEAELLGHLRGPGPHVRGCHVLDALLGKT